MTEAHPAPRSPGARVAAALLLCALAAGCSSAREQATPAHDVDSARPAAAAPPPSAAPAAPPNVAAASPAAAAAPAETSPGAAPAAPPAAPEPPPVRAADGPYARFFAALRELEQGKRKDHVRIVWLGDSHGLSDFWSGTVRRALQKRFGHGGIGFVHIGYGPYRHDGMKVAADGKWRMRPPAPASTAATGDGVFGLGGIVFTPGEGSVRAELAVQDPGMAGPVIWDICYRMSTPTDRLALTLSAGDTKAPTLLAPTPASPPGQIRHAQLFSDGTATLGVTPAGGAPELCGAVIEADPSVKAGVVLDTVAINGARLATPLAWNEASWSAELARRSPELVVLQYGTNESGDFNVEPAQYGKHLNDVLARVRKVSPDVDCLALAPTDRKDTPERTPLVRDAIRAAATAAGCAFWDTYEAMGGKGSIAIWQSEEPPRAAKDGVHLTSRGYRELGGKLADAILQHYQP